MHLSPNLFSFIVLIKLFTTNAQNNDSKLYFPSDAEGFSQVHYNYNKQVQRVPADLESIRGTSTYEESVTEIISSGIARLTVTLNRLLSDHARSNNVVFSPISITGALALVLLGSNGVTFKEISELWGLQAGIPDLDKKSQIVHEQFSRIIDKLIATSGFDIGHHVSIASAIFLQAGYPIRPLYKSTAEKLYHSTIVNVDFKENPRMAQLQVNKWVEQNTNGKIKNILNDLPSSETRVIIASALYFNAEWEHHFFQGSTRRRPFFVNGRKSPSVHEVELMSNGGEFPYYKDLERRCEILGLPYKGNRSTMYVIMPFDSDAQKVHQFEALLTAADLENMVGKTKTTGAVILFPKMKIESSIDLRKSLEALGVKSLFDPKTANLALLSPGELSYRMDLENGVNFRPDNNGSTTFFRDTSRQVHPRTQAVPNISTRNTETLDNIRQLLNQQSSDSNLQNPGLYADQVIHKVYMDINEKGTEAAAATSVSLSRDGSRVTFRVDVPFFFFIRHDETKTILFWGSVVVPTPNYPVDPVNYQL